MYITFYAKQKRQLTFQDLYENFNADLTLEQQRFPFKITKNVEITNANYKFYSEKPQVTLLKHFLTSDAYITARGWDQYSHLLKDIPKEYTTFQIPKHSGGFRTIEAPSDALKAKLTIFKKAIENQGQWQAHDAAYAYIKHRSVKDALEKHKDSNWFLKLDIHGFFPSCNAAVIKTQIAKVFPFAFLELSSIEHILSFALLNDHLPQGTPLSPLLTNIIMVPFDTELSKTLGKDFVYTRYADDILISSKYKFDWQKIQNDVQTLLKNLDYPFQLNKEKTRFGSISGRNWNLGLMLNKDHKITLGYQKKQRFKAAIFNFCNDLTNGRTWDRIDVQVLQGQLAYGKNIEPEYFNNLIKKYEQKFNINFAETCKRIINS